MHKLFPRIRLGILGIEKLQPAFGFTGHRVAHNVVSLSHENKMISIYTFLEQRTITNEHSGFSTTYFGDFWRTNINHGETTRNGQIATRKEVQSVLDGLRLQSYILNLDFISQLSQNVMMTLNPWNSPLLYSSKSPRASMSNHETHTSMQLGRSVRLS